MNSPRWVAKQLYRNSQNSSLSQKVHAILRETWNDKVTFAVSCKRDAKSLYYPKVKPCWIGISVVISFWILFSSKFSPISIINSSLLRFDRKHWTGTARTKLWQSRADLLAPLITTYLSGCLESTLRDTCLTFFYSVSRAMFTRLWSVCKKQ